MNCVHHYCKSKLVSCNFPQHPVSEGVARRCRARHHQPVQTGNKMSSTTEADCAGATDVAQAQDAPVARPLPENTSTAVLIVPPGPHTPSLKIWLTLTASRRQYAFPSFYHRIEGTKFFIWKPTSQPKQQHRVPQKVRHLSGQAYI